MKRKRGEFVERTQLLKGILEGCILQIIKNNKTYGYGILEILEKSGFSDITEGTIYPLLIRLEKQGILSAEMMDSPLGPKRKYYSLTQKGEMELAEFEKEWNSLRASVDIIMDGGKNDE